MSYESVIDNDSFRMGDSLDLVLDSNSNFDSDSVVELHKNCSS